MEVLQFFAGTFRTLAKALTTIAATSVPHLMQRIHRSHPPLGPIKPEGQAAVVELRHSVVYASGES